jgi:hypothetical protein
VVDLYLSERSIFQMAWRTLRREFKCCLGILQLVRTTSRPLMIWIGVVPPAGTIGEVIQARDIGIRKENGYIWAVNYTMVCF